MADLPKLGKHLGVVHDPRTLALWKIALPDVTLPAQFDAAHGLTFAMGGNDVHSDCLAAGAGNQERVFSHEKVAPSLSQTLAFYDLFNGGQDQGGYTLDMLNAWRKTGLAVQERIDVAALDAYLAAL